MDGLSAAVNILTLLDIAAKLITLGSAYASSSRGHHREVQHFVRELETLSGVLASLNAALESNNVRKPSFIEGPLKECETQLTDLHKMLVQQVSGRNRWIRLGRALRWPLKEKETRMWIERMERFKGNFSLALQTEDMGVRGKMSTNIEEMKKSQEDTRKEKQQARERRKLGQVQAWLSPIDAPDAHATIRKLQHRDSGKWFIEGNEFTAWKSTDRSFLWLCGNQGAGKTVLTSLIIDHLIAQRQPDEKLAYFYCTPTTKPIHLYGSLIAQLLDPASPPPAYISDYYEANSHRRPYEHELKDILLKLLSSIPNTKAKLVIIDGLSELPDKADLVTTISELQRTCSILIASRSDDDISDAFFAETKTYIYPAMVEEDTTAFVNSEMQRRPSLKRLSLELRSEVVGVITGNSGNWGWVVAALELVARMRTDRDVRDVLRTLRGDDGNDSGVEDLDGDF